MKTWIAREEALLARLNRRDEGAARATLLAVLAEYSADAVRAARSAPRESVQPQEVERATSWLARPVFICGHHRSGTTLLQELLDGHPELVVLPSEGTYFSSFGYVTGPQVSELDLDRFAAEWVARFVDPNYEPHFKLGRSAGSHNPYVGFASRLFAWHAVLPRAMPGLAPFGAMLALVAAYQQPSQAAPRMWVEKTPLNERYVHRFAAFEQARFLHVVRDPGDSLASLLQTLRSAGVAEPRAALHAADIGRSLRLARTHAAKLGARYQVVRYEDLVNPAAREMERVRAFLGIGAHDSLGIATSVGIPVRSNSSFVRGAPGSIERSAHGTRLRPEESLLLRVLAGDPARAFGYELAPVPAWRKFLVRMLHAPAALRQRLG